MDKDQAGGKLDQVAGKIKQKAGEAVGNDRLANEGVADQAKGSAQETWGNVKDAVHSATQKTTGGAATESSSGAHATSDSISDTIADVKNRVTTKSTISKTISARNPRRSMVLLTCSQAL